MCDTHTMEQTNGRYDMCLYPGCEKGTNARGLCLSHYRCAWNAVKAKQVTWEQLYENKKALPPRASGYHGGVRGWFLEGVK